LEFIKTPEYADHKKNHFPKEDLEIPIAENDAFLLSDQTIRADYKSRYQLTKSLYYQGQPNFDDLIANIKKHIGEL
jgi:hypothetical protein